MDSAFEMDFAYRGMKTWPQMGFAQATEVYHTESEPEWAAVANRLPFLNPALGESVGDPLLLGGVESGVVHMVLSVLQYRSEPGEDQLVLLEVVPEVAHMVSAVTRYRAGPVGDRPVSWVVADHN